MSKRISQTRLRDLYGLVSDCLSLGADGVGWRHHLVSELVRLLDVDMAFFADYEIIGHPGPVKDRLRPTFIVDHCPTKEKGHRFWQAFLRGTQSEHTPLAHMLAGHEGVRIVSRRDAIPAARAYQPGFDQHSAGSMDMGDFLYSVSRDSNGTLQIMAIQRTVGRQDLPRWIVHWLRALWVELRRMQPEKLLGVENSLFTLVPRRRLQVLACLLSGCTVNETAGLLKISQNTAQEHVKRLYQQLGARNRAELAARCKAAVPVLLALPLDEFPDYSRDARHATRAPRRS